MGERTNHAEHHAQPFQPAVSRRFLSALRRETTRLAASRADRAMLTEMANTFTLLMGKGEAAGRRAWMEKDGGLVEADV